MKTILFAVEGGIPEGAFYPIFLGLASLGVCAVGDCPVRRHVCRFGGILTACRNENLIFNLFFLTK